MESVQQNPDAFMKYKMSWVAYIRPIIYFIVLGGIGYVLIHYNYWVGTAVMLFSLALFIFNTLTLNSFVLYTDDDGVWVFRGILPWSKGVSGVKWRDLEDAVFFTNFFSWLFKSYTIRVGHRFTKTSEIVLPHIARGREAVVHINELHKQYVADNDIKS